MLRRVRQSGRYIILLSTVLAIFYLVFSTPNYRKKPCDPLIRGNIQELCQSLFDGNEETIQYASKFSWCRREDVLTDFDYYSYLPENCRNFTQLHGYFTHDISDDEKNFPIAFGILVHENVEQVIMINLLIS